MVEKGHSDIEDAIRIAQKMEASYLALTHFSQKYNTSMSKKEYIKIKVNREDNDDKEYFFSKCFMVQDFMYIDFELLSQYPQWNSIYNNYDYN